MKDDRQLAARSVSEIISMQDIMSTMMIRNVKLAGDALHLVSYPLVFWSLRGDRRIGISRNSQMLFFIALLFRYSSLLRETGDMRESVKNLSALYHEGVSIQGLVHIYKKKHSTYSFLLRLIPLLSSACVVLRISTAYYQREARDTLSWKLLLLLSGLAALLLHHNMNPPVSAQDPWAVLKTASYFVEAVAIVPQLYLDVALKHPPQQRAGHHQSFTFETHLIARGLFRACYVFPWLYKLLQAGQLPKLESFGDNVQQWAGMLQMVLYFEVFWKYLRGRSGVLLSVTCCVLLLHINGLQSNNNNNDSFLEGLLFIMTSSSLLSQLLGGFTMVQLTFLYFICQLYRAGMITFRVPFSSEEL